MPWSIFSDGGGPGVALTWAVDLLKRLGAPLSAGNEQLVYDWETSEGGGGKYNPLNEGPVPGDSALTSTGSQYGGGAADFVSWSAGLTGAVDYLSMPAYQSITDDLRSNDPTQARADIIASPWASTHYNGGSAFSDAAAPGKAAALPAGPSSGPPSSAAPESIGGGIGGLIDSITHIGTDFESIAIIAPIVLGGGALVVFGFIKMTDAKAAPKVGATL